MQRISMQAGPDHELLPLRRARSVASITGSAGATRWIYSFAPFGTIRSDQQGAGTQPANFMKYTGEYLDRPGSITCGRGDPEK